jgi:hypothetical protein
MQWDDSRAMERRPLAAAIQSIPSADPDAVRRFVTQDPRTPTNAPSFAEQETPRRQRPAPSSAIQPSLTPPKAQQPNKSTATAPIGLIPVTVRLRPEIAGALKRASLERQLAGEELFTQQQLIAAALEPWLRGQGYLP